MVIHLQNADDTSLNFLALFLPCLVRYAGRHNIVLLVRNDWSATIQAWHAIDEVFYLVARDSVYVARMMLGILSWEELPYRCMDGLLEQMLPKCTSQAIIQRCHKNSCGLHNEQERRCLKPARPNPELSERGATVSNTQMVDSPDIMEGDGGSEVQDGHG